VPSSLRFCPPIRPGALFFLSERERGRGERRREGERKGGREGKENEDRRAFYHGEDLTVTKNGFVAAIGWFFSKEKEGGGRGGGEEKRRDEEEKKGSGRNAAAPRGACPRSS